MGMINRLSEQLSNMIAAGEVVERPSGIVKELVENCIDAKATQIEVQAEEGGIVSLTVIDDGIGMDSEDALLAFERHATSKIKESNDLWNIHTMGFRGEALPSIASVSHVLLRTNNGVEGSEVEIKYGKLDHAGPVGTPRGTAISVKNLFQKTPARFKHLKTPQYEFSLISDVIQKFALSHPEIAFTLSHDGRTTFQSKGSGSLQEVIMQIYGREVAKSAIALNRSDNDYQIEGYAIQPQFNRATKYYMLLYINGRMIRSYRLQKAIVDAYAPYMPKDRYPIVVINVKMDAQLVDVNVHPSKWEIRLSKEKQLERLLFDTLQTALRQEITIPEVTTLKEKEKVEMPELVLTYANEKETTKIHQSINQSFYEPKDNEEHTMQIQTMTLEELFAETKVEEPNEQYEAVKAMNEEIQNQTKSEHLENDIEKDESNAIPSNFPQLQVIGQFHNCYILAQGEKGLYIIDQHAAEERFHYEQFQTMLLAGNVKTQPLLIPITLDVSTQVIAQIDALNQMMSILGITFEVFGDHSLVCRELPVWLKDVEEKQYLQDMVDVFLKDEEVCPEKVRKDALASLACHSSIRFHRSLTIEEMKQVIVDLSLCKQPYHCPHGRPTMIVISEKDLEKDFKRIM